MHCIETGERCCFAFAHHGIWDSYVTDEVLSDEPGFVSLGIYRNKCKAVVVVSQFNGTSTPKGSYSAKSDDNDCNVNSSRYSISILINSNVWEQFAIRPSLNKMSNKIWYPGCATGRLLSCTPKYKADGTGSAVTTNSSVYVTSLQPFASVCVSDTCLIYKF